MSAREQRPRPQIQTAWEIPTHTPRGPQVGLTITKGTAGQPTPAKSAALLRRKVAAFSASPVLYPLLLNFATKCALPGGRIPSGGPALG